MPNIISCTKLLLYTELYHIGGRSSYSFQDPAKQMDATFTSPPTNTPKAAHAAKRTSGFSTPAMALRAYHVSV